MDRIKHLTIGGRLVVILGDPHLGRAFVNGVPLHRRGEREIWLMNDFKASLDLDPDAAYHVCTGDLFDKWFVPYGIVWEAATAYIAAARRRPDVEFIVLAGNHDVSKDLEKKGALDLFELATAAVANIKVVRRGAYYTWIGTMKAGFFPYHATLEADELITEAMDLAFGHWDTVFGDHNMVPTERLAAAGATVAYTGHVHLPDEFKRDGIHVVQVGSLQPLAHGEDDGQMYLTIKPCDLEGSDWSQKCVRILLEPGEICGDALDCLQLSFKRAASAGNVEEDLEVGFGEFDITKLFAQAFDEVEVPDGIRIQLLSRYEEARVKE